MSVCSTINTHASHINPQTTQCPHRPKNGKSRKIERRPRADHTQASRPSYNNTKTCLHPSGPRGVTRTDRRPSACSGSRFRTNCSGTQCLRQRSTQSEAWARCITQRMWRTRRVALYFNLNRKQKDVTYQAQLSTNKNKLRQWTSDRKSMCRQRQGAEQRHACGDID